MNILSVVFLGFLLLVMLVYYCCPAKLQKCIILLASMGFAVTYGKKNTVFLFGMIFISWFFGTLLQKSKKKFVFTAGIIFSLFPLILFKYSPVDLSRILVPVGISFFTFRIVSYLADLYHGKCEAASLLDYAVYVSFFPTLISGPIDRAGEFIPQLQVKHKIDIENLKAGSIQMLYGFLIKMVLADRLAVIVNTVFTNWGGYSGFALFITSVLYTIQIYCDFAGYTCIALGVARMLGLQCRQNFMQPYFATSVQDFWRRWHISLSTWLRDYVYIPLGGNRKGEIRKYINLMITFLVSGIWHGVGIKFLFWGGVHGVLQIAGALTKEFRGNLKKKMHIYGKLEKALALIITFLMINFTWVIFWGSSFHASAHILLNICKPSAISFAWIPQLGITNGQCLIMGAVMLVVLIVDILKERKVDLIQGFWKLALPIRWMLLMTCLVVIIVFGMYGPGYDAASFIYFKF